MAVIDMKTREIRRIEQHKPEPVPVPTDAERTSALAANCETMIMRAAQMILAACGLDAALKALGSVADFIRHEGRRS